MEDFLKLALSCRPIPDLSDYMGLIPGEDIPRVYLPTILKYKSVY